MRKIRWPEASERAPKSLLKNCPTPPVPWLIPATMLADQGWDRFGIEGGSEVVLMGSMLPRTKVCVAVVEGEKLAGRETSEGKEKIWVLKLNFKNIYDRSVTYPKGIIEDVFIRVKKFVFPADFFLILDVEEDHEIPLLLGRPFLTIAGTLKDVQQGTLTLRVQGESIEFKVFEVVKKLRDF
ncbi:hypothetical protein L3X38_040614 [Prunus dulcis]|uniref:Uncharacterized protein n=1 Tax=Prunus dulcis TaxID=3755 RepID=A0AAD4VAM2_PRUDU|nr:hypothetical protein L3X38_040614 [Prunus dulcis]